MRKMFLALFFVMVMTLPAMAQVTIDGPSTSGALSPIGGANAQAGATASAISTNANTNTNVNTNTQIGINTQGQLQGQLQGQSQFGFVAPYQESTQETSVSFKSPTQLLISPSQSVPELNFGNGKMQDVTGKLPNFAMYGIKPLKDEAIREVIDVTANIKFKRLYKKVLGIAKDIVEDGYKTTEIRYQIVRAEAQKTWTTGGNLGGAGSYLPTSGLAGASGAGSLVPQWGGTKADDLFTIIFVKIAL